MTHNRIITLLTDFGQNDGFVGIMKGVILSINPDVTLVDLAHDIPAGDIDAAAFVLNQAFPYFPEKAIHLIVVDPGVGSERRALAVEAQNRYFIAPDNGVLKWIVDRYSNCKVMGLNQSKYFLPTISRTFHGRDVFAPVAAHLSKGVPFEDLGQPVSDFIRGKVPRPMRKENGLIGAIIHIDRFGNLISDITELDLQRGIGEIKIADVSIFGLSDAYSQAKSGEPLAIIGSHGFLEIAVREGHAASELAVSRGTRIEILFAGEAA